MGGDGGYRNGARDSEAAEQTGLHGVTISVSFVKD